MAKAKTEEALTEETASVAELEIPVGNTPPAELFARTGGAGRSRQATRFDDAMPALYEHGKNDNWAGPIPARGEDGVYNEDIARELINEIKRAAALSRDEAPEGYGLDIRPDKTNGDIWFKVRDKSNRGRPKGSKKNPATGKFEVPDENGNFSDGTSADNATADDDDVVLQDA